MDEDIIIKSVAFYKDGEQIWIFNEKLSRDYVAGMVIATSEILEGLRKEDFSLFYFSIQRSDRKNVDYIFEATNLSLDFKKWKENYFELFSKDDKYSFKFENLLNKKSSYIFFKKKKLLERFIGGFRDVCHSYNLNINEFNVECKHVNGEKLLDLYNINTEIREIDQSEYVKIILPAKIDTKDDSSTDSDDAQNHQVLDDN